MTTNPRQRGWLRRARFDYAAALALCLLLYGVDMALKASASPGVAPPSWDWQVEASDLPAIWDAWQALPAYASLRETAPASLQEIAVYVRKLTGVRPTPERLRFWLGHHLLLSGEGSDWVLSCRPGIALRIATLFQPALTEPADAGSESREFPYAWRGQFLLIASSQTFLNTVLSQGAPTQARDREPLSLTVAWTGPDAGELELRPTDGLPVILSLPGNPVDSGPLLRRPESWPGTTVWLACRGENSAALVRRVGRVMTALLIPDDLATALAPPAMAWWESFSWPVSAPPEATPWLAGVFDLDLAADLPSVELAWAEFEGGGSARLDLPSHHAQPHRWNELDGWLVNVPAAARAWAVAEHDGALLLASHEHLMPRIAGTEFPGSPDTCIALHVAWDPLGKALAALARRAAELELLPEMNEDDVKARMVPVFEAIQAWGVLELQIVASGSGLQGTGFLARPLEGPT